MIQKIPFKIITIPGKGCHIMCTAALSGYKVNLLIDTGASLTVFDVSRYRKIFPQTQINSFKDSFRGVGTDQIKTFTAVLDEISFEGLTLTALEILLIDLENINHTYAQYDLDKIDGVLGGDLLQRLQAKIDYTDHSITLCL